MTILEEAHNPIIIVEHASMLYKDAAEMVDYVSYALADAAKEAAVLLYAPGLVSSWMAAGNADRIWHFNEGF